MSVRNAPKWIVYRNGQPAPELQPLRIQRSLNGERMDYAELMLDTKYVPNFNGLDDFSPFDYIGNYIDIQVAGGSYVHQGMVVNVAPKFSQAEAGLMIASRTDPCLFGLTLFGQAHWNPVTNEFVVTDDELVFNPTIDGRTQGNKHDSKTLRNVQFANQTTQVTNEIPIFLHPEAVRTPAARKLHKGNAISWTLSEVLYYLCWMANRTQAFLVNPTLDELQVAVTDSIDLVRNLKVKAGSTLPEALDAALIPLGYHWRLIQQGAFALNKLQIIRKSVGGSLRFLKHQRMGQQLSTGLTDTESLGVRFDTDRMANQIVAKGAKIQVEITAELYRGWPENLDATPIDQLKKDVVEASENQDMRNVWRKWVLNEAGDYIGTRPEIKGVYSPQLLKDFTVGGFDDLADSNYGTLSRFVPRRRKFLPTLTLNASGTHPIGQTNGIEIEYRDYNGNWLPAKEWSFAILDTECGIYLRGEDIPEELYDQGEYAAIRVIATIESDSCATAISYRSADSPLRITKEEYIDLGDSYQLRSPVAEYPKYGDFSNRGYRFDEEALADFADSLRSRFDQLDIPGGVVLEGVDHLEYQPGDRIGGVQGKNISFEVKKGSNQYPQIVSVTLDITEQKTILALQRFREFRPA